MFKLHDSRSGVLQYNMRLDGMVLFRFSTLSQGVSHRTFTVVDALCAVAAETGYQMFRGVVLGLDGL